MNHAEAGKLGYEKSRQQLTRWCAKVHQQAKKRWGRKVCLECGKVIPYEKRCNKYCSHSCASTATNRGVCRHGKPRLRSTCELCGKALNKGRRFCSRKCSGAAKAKVQFSRLDKLESFEGERDGAVRRYLIEKLGVKCQLCGRKKWGKQVIPMVMDHVDGDSTNWRRSNLRLICPNCDAQTVTFKGRNRGNGRHYRRVRYAEGKSF